MKEKKSTDRLLDHFKHESIDPLSLSELGLENMKEKKSTERWVDHLNMSQLIH